MEHLPEKKIPYASSFVKAKKNGKFLLDLFAVNIQQALDAGLLLDGSESDFTFNTDTGRYSLTIKKEEK